MGVVRFIIFVTSATAAHAAERRLQGEPQCRKINVEIKVRSDDLLGYGQKTSWDLIGAPGCSMGEGSFSPGKTTTTTCCVAPGMYEFEASVSMDWIWAPCTYRVWGSNVKSEIGPSNVRFDGWGYGELLIVEASDEKTCEWVPEDCFVLETSGGAVHNEGILTAIECVFLNNEANNDCSLCSKASESDCGRQTGGAVHNSGLFTATNCSFDGNKAGEAQGGQDIFIDASASTVLRNCRFLTSTQNESRVYGCLPRSCDNGGGCGGTYGATGMDGFCTSLKNEGESWGITCTEPCPMGSYGRPTTTGGCTKCPSARLFKRTVALLGDN